ncbi:Uma2 family endonuclease [Fibrella aquatica]|jgi:Uma2 family endonuclease|uniref:Uma2 family endonuclease n=1 Tax=Fibrella aquatica TaxID=3242487 RepID=UPI0035215454
MEAVIDQLSDYELERGKPMPTTVHAAIQTNIAAELKVRYRKQYRVLTEITLATQPKDSVPDVALYPYFQLDYQHDTASRTDAPLVAVEIISPSQSLSQMIEKAGRYFAFGVTSCWIVIPDMKAIAVYSSPTSYQFFMGNDVVKDSNVPVELPLDVVFD